MTNPTITVRTIVHPAAASAHVEGGLDHDVEVWLTDEEGEESLYHGEITMVPDEINGGMTTHGDDASAWMSGTLVDLLYGHTSWVAPHDRLVRTIVQSIKSGAGEETIEVSL